MRTRMYISKHFTVSPNTSIIFKDCVLKTYNPVTSPTMNIYKNHFEGEVVLENVEIYIEDTAIEFLDMIEYYTKKTEELILS